MATAWLRAPETGWCLVADMLATLGRAEAAGLDAEQRINRFADCLGVDLEPGTKT